MRTMELWLETNIGKVMDFLGEYPLVLLIGLLLFPFLIILVETIIILIFRGQ